MKSCSKQHPYPRFEIVREDFDSIYHNFLCWGNWSVTYRQRPNRKPQAAATLCNSDVGRFLLQHDYLEKDSPTKILGIIPSIYKHYWWRGYVDADGCFYYNRKNYIRQFSISSRFDQNWSELFNMLLSVGVNDFYYYQADLSKKKKPKNSKYSEVKVCQKEAIIKIGQYIYDGNDIGLSRKRDKFETILNS